jgi:hypothetical protein
MDPVIFTGRVSEDDLRHEHPDEYERLRQEGGLARIAAPPPPLWMRNFSRVVGFGALATGTVLVWLIIATALR